jgi:general secretion pathway protein M
MNKLQAWYSGLQEREQRMVAIGGIAMAFLILVVGILMPLHSAVSTAVSRNETKRDDLEWMQENASVIRAAGNQLPATTGEARGTQPSGTGVRVQLEAAPFDTMITWLATLDEHYGLSIESITVDRAVRPGAVNANITFAQSRH